MKPAGAHILIIGGAGFIGRRVVRWLLQAGHRPSVLDRTRPDLPGAVPVFVADRREPGVLVEIARRWPFEAVFDLAAYDPEDSRAAADAFFGRTRRFVHLSTIATYLGSRSLEISEDAAIRREPGTEDYGACKEACERELLRQHRARSFPMVIVRAAPVFGPEDPVSRENRFLRCLLRNRPIFLPDPSAHLFAVFVDDLARALVTAAFAEGVVGQAYHLAQGERVTLAEHVRAIGTAASIQVRIEQASFVPGRNPAAQPYAGLPGAGWLDCRRAERDLDFRATPHEKAVADTVHFLLSRGPFHWPAWPGRGTMQSRLAGTHDWLESAWDIAPSLREERSLTADDIIGVLAGGRSAAPRTAIAVGWPPSAARSAEGARRWIVVPPSLLSHIAPQSSPCAAQPPSKDGDASSVEAVLEPNDATAVGRAAWLFTRADASRAQGFRRSNLPVSVAFVPFSARHRAPPVGERDRTVLIAETPLDAAALRQWVEEAEASGHLDVPSPAQASRTYISYSCQAALDPGPRTPPGTGGCQGSLRGPMRWLAAYDLVRLFQWSGALPESGPLQLELSSAGRELVVAPAAVHPAGGNARQIGEWMLARVADRLYLWPNGRDVLVRVSPGVAALFELIQSGVPLPSLAAPYAAHLRCTSQEAQRRIPVVLARLVQAQVISLEQEGALRRALPYSSAKHGELDG